MMNLRRLVVVLAFLATPFLGTPCRAQGELRQAGKTWFGLAIFSAPGDTAVQDTLSLYVSAFAGRAYGPSGTVHVSIPSGLSLISGDTAYTSPVRAGTPAHRLKLRASRSGAFEIRASAEIGAAPGELDLCETSLMVVVAGKTLRPGGNIIHRMECVRNGRRYRVAGWYLVPMDEGDVFDDVEFEQGGTPVRIKEAPASICGDCQAELPDTLHAWVMVDKAGKVTGADIGGRRDGRQQSAKLIAAVKAMLSKWSFEPARIGNRPVNDWCEVSVPVRSR